MKLIVVKDSYYSSKHEEIDLETGFINGSSNWLFLGLSHKRNNYFIPRTEITKEKIGQMNDNGEMYYKNGKCQYTVRDSDYGTIREWGSPEVSAIFIME